VQMAGIFLTTVFVTPELMYTRISE
jgi:hypothetical protein